MQQHNNQTSKLHFDNGSQFKYHDQYTAKTVAGMSGPGIMKRNRHVLSVNDHHVSCMLCDTKKEIPDIFAESSDYVEIVYRLYLVGQFDHESCEPSKNDLKDVTIQEKRITDGTRTPPQVPIHWSDTTTNDAQDHETLSDITF